MAAAAAAASAGNNGSPLYNDFSLSADLFATRPWTALNTLCATSATDPYSIERAAKLYRNAASQFVSLIFLCLRVCGSLRLLSVQCLQHGLCCRQRPHDAAKQRCEPRYLPACK